MSGALFFALDATLREDTPTSLVDWLMSAGRGIAPAAPPEGAPRLATEMAEQSAWLLGLQDVDVTTENGRLRVSGHVRLRDDGYENQAVYGTSFLVTPFVDHEIIGVTWSTWSSLPSVFLAQDGRAFTCSWGDEPTPVDHGFAWDHNR